MKQVFARRVLLVSLLLSACGSAAWARGLERFGSASLSEGNYKSWPGIVSLVNHPSRVYYTWVNGNEHFYFRGDVAALNDSLRALAGAKGNHPEVVLRPGIGGTRTFDGSRHLPFGWSLHLVGGSAGHLLTRDQGEKVWAKHPVLTIYVGELDLRKVRIPAGLTVLSVADVTPRVRQGLKSRDRTVRGWGSGILAALDPYSSASRDVIAGLLKDNDPWVRLNAAAALARFGRKARPVLPLLRRTLETEDAPLKATVQQSIQAIEQAEDRTVAERTHRETLERIRRFVSQRKQ